MSIELMKLSEQVGEASASRLGPAGLGDLRSRVQARRRRRAVVAALAAAIVAPAVALGVWQIAALGTATSDPATVVPLILTDAPIETQLRDAVLRGDHDRMRQLIELGVYTDQPFATPLTALALERCDLDALAILDAAGFPRGGGGIWPQMGDDESLAAAVEHCDVATVEQVFLETGPLRDLESGMIAVIEHADAGTLTRLVQLGLPLEAPGDWSAIAIAIDVGREPLVPFLLGLGARVDVEVDGGALIDVVSRTGSAETLALVRARLEDAS